MQTRVLQLAGPGGGPQVPALSSSAVYAGATMGAGLGGWLIGTAGAGTLPVAAAVCAVAALALFGLAERVVPRSAPAGERKVDRTRA